MRFRAHRLVAVFVLSVALLAAAPGCATLGTPPGQGAQTEAQRLAELSRVIGQVDTVVSLVKAAQASEINLFRSQAIAISEETHQKVQRAFLTFADLATPAVTRLGDVATPEADRKVAARAVFDGSRDVLSVLKVGGPSVESWAAALEGVLAAAGVL